MCQILRIVKTQRATREKAVRRLRLRNFPCESRANVLRNCYYAASPLVGEFMVVVDNKAETTIYIRFTTVFIDHG